MNHILFVSYFPLTHKVISDFYFNELSTDCKITYLDLTRLFFPELAKTSETNWQSIVYIGNYKELKEYLLSLNPEDCLVNMITTFEGRTLKLYRTIYKLNFKVSIIGKNMVPLAPFQRDFRFRHFTVERLILFLKNRYLKFLITTEKLKPFDLVFEAGNYGWQGIGQITKNFVNKSKTIKINSDDYDRYLKFISGKSNNTNEAIVFLDEYLPLHPDTIAFKLKTVPAKEYYTQLNKFFKVLEIQYKSKIILAAHPKADPSVIKKYVDRAEVIQGKTIDLVQTSKFILAHDSTSICYPVLFNKPILFITSNLIIQNIISVHLNTQNFAKVLNSRIENIDNVLENGSSEFIPQIDLESYDQYKYNYLTSQETENIHSSSIFKAIFNQKQT